MAGHACPPLSPALSRLRERGQHRRLTALLLLIAAWTTPAAALDLTEAWALALKNEPGWLAARAGAEAAREAEAQARAQLLPNIQFAGSGSRVHLDDYTASGAAPTDRDYSSYNLTLSLRQTVYRKPQFAQLEQARAQVRLADAEQEQARRELLLRVAAAYYDSLYADEALAAAKAKLDAAELQLAAARRGFALGQGTRTDIDETLARRDLAQTEVLKAGQQVGYARQQLATLIGGPVDTLAPLDPARFRATPAEGSLEDWLARAEAGSPELQALKARVEAAEKEVDKARGGRLPTLDLVAQGGKSQSESPQNLGTRYNSAQIGLQFALPLYSGGQLDSAVRQAMASLERERQSLEQGRRALGLAVRKEYQNLSEGAARLAALEQAARSAARMRIGVDKGLRAGTRTRVDLINAHQQEADVARELALARYQHLLADLKLRSLAGGVDAVLGKNNDAP